MNTVAVSVRNTLDDGTGDSLSPGKVTEVGRALLNRLRDEGHTVLIYDTYANTSLALRSLVQWLNVNELPFTDIWDGYGKPKADLYIDGLAISPSEYLK